MGAAVVVMEEETSVLRLLLWDFSSRRLCRHPVKGNNDNRRDTIMFIDEVERWRTRWYTVVQG